LLVAPIHTLVTMDAQRRELSDAAMWIEDNRIIAVGARADMPARRADRTLDLRHHVVVPGLINTHHHMFQSLTRVMAQDQELFGWLKTLYPLWSRLTAESVYVSAQLAMAELLLSGCTTTSDHLYLFPNDVRLDDEIQAAYDMGMRFMAARGSMSVGEKLGGLPPDHLVEAEDDILTDTRRLIEAYHNGARGAMLQIAVAPCSPFSVSQDLMRESAALARSYGVRLHTHLAENANDIAYSLEMFGLLPGDYAQDVGWLGDDVWHAHCVGLNEREIGVFARTHTGVCHCPTSNLRLASGIAPVRKMRDHGVPVGLGVDGAASNDSGGLLEEVRMAMLCQRADGDPQGMSAREALELATLGGAAVLGRTDIGALEPGRCADFAAFRLDQIGFAGAQYDPVAALIFCRPSAADVVCVNGVCLVSDGHLTRTDLPVLLERHNRLSKHIIDRR